jgi:hypothetical protein
MSRDESGNSDILSLEEIERCISVLETLVADTDQIFEIPKDRRTALVSFQGQVERNLLEERKTLRRTQSASKQQEISMPVRKQE